MKKIYIAVIILLLADSGFAETVILKNKKVLKGKVVGQDVRTIRLKVDGKVELIPKKNILKVVFRDVSQEEADRIRKQEEEKLRAKEAEIKRLAEEARNKAEEEARLAEEKKAEEERLAEEQRLATEKDARQAEKLKKKSGMSPITASALLPGLGQIKSGYKKSGYGWMTAFFGTLAVAASQKSKYDEAKRAYDTSFTPNNILANGLLENGLGLPKYTLFLYNSSALYSEYQESGKKYNSAVAGLGLIYIVQLWHTWYVGKKPAVADNSSIMNNIDFGVALINEPYQSEQKTFISFRRYF